MNLSKPSEMGRNLVLVFVFVLLSCSSDRSVRQGRGQTSEESLPETLNSNIGLSVVEANQGQWSSES